MLNIGQIVYTVCKLWTSKKNFKMYVSKKEICGINRDNDRVITYTAGKHRELRFKEYESGKYGTVTGHRKNVFLTKEEAEEELKVRMENEKVESEETTK